MSNTRVLVMYNARSQDSLLATAYAKKRWVDDQRSLPDEYGKAFLEHGNKIAGYDGTMTFMDWKNGDKFPDFDYFESVILLGITLPARTLKFLFKRMEDDLIWIDCKLNIPEGIDKDFPAHNQVAGFRSEIFSLAAMYYMFSNNVFEDLPFFIKMMLYDCTEERSADFSEEEHHSFIKNCSSNMKSYNDWYTTIKHNTTTYEMREFVRNMIDNNVKTQM